MPIEPRTTEQPVRPSYPPASLAERTAMALVAVLVSTTLLGSVSSMFAMRIQEAAIARTSVKGQLSADGLVVRKLDSRPRS
jgi:hypothetical protein